ncbi:MAG TPA: group II truncated hemoglobin [Propionibacteriaceae bacterium]
MASSVYDAAGGAPAFLALAQAWHDRCLEDPVLNHPFSNPGHPLHLERLAAYWGEALGGPAAYTQELGDHSDVLRMHAGNGEHQDLDDRAQVCFARAIEDADLPADERLRSTLRGYFQWVTAEMSDYPDSPDDVPAGLAVPRWSWDGPVSAGR